jgi:hypothetical protein
LAADAELGRAAFAEGQKLVLAGDFRGALTWFKNGYLQTQDVAFLLNIAQCQRSLGENQEALMMFRLYLKSSPPETNPQARAVAAKAIQELESEAKTAPSAPSAAASARPASASAGPAPAAAGATAASGVPPTNGSGRRLGAGLGEMPVLAPMPELDAARAAAAAANAPDAMAPTRRHLRLAAMICGAVGLASVGTGVYFWTRARSLSDSANRTTVFDQGTYDDGKRAETMQWIFYSAGAAVVATGVGLFVYSTLLSAPKKTSVSVAPMVGPGATGLAAGGTF